jgi:hypothetical protein
MKGNFKRYVNQITQNVIALLHMKNLNQDQSYRSVKIEKSRRVVESRPVCMDL